MLVGINIAIEREHNEHLAFEGNCLSGFWNSVSTSSPPPNEMLLVHDRPLHRFMGDSLCGSRPTRK